MLKLHPVLLDEFENVANRPIRLDSHVGPDLFDILKFSLPIWSVFARSVDSPSHLGIDVITDPLEISLHLILLVQQSIPSTCLLTMSVSEFFLKSISFIRGQLVSRTLTSCSSFMFCRSASSSSASFASAAALRSRKDCLFCSLLLILLFRLARSSSALPHISSCLSAYRSHGIIGIHL
jgi:hypothetical protein